MESNELIGIFFSFLKTDLSSLLVSSLGQDSNLVTLNDSDRGKSECTVGLPM